MHYIFTALDSTDGLSPKAVYDCLIAVYGSWEKALNTTDGRAVIDKYLGPSFTP